MLKETSFEQCSVKLSMQVENVVNHLNQFCFTLFMRRQNAEEKISNSFSNSLFFGKIWDDGTDPDVMCAKVFVCPFHQCVDNCVKWVILVNNHKLKLMFIGFKGKQILKLANSKFQWWSVMMSTKSLVSGNDLTNAAHGRLCGNQVFLVV